MNQFRQYGILFRRLKQIKLLILVSDLAADNDVTREQTAGTVCRGYSMLGNKIPSLAGYCERWPRQDTAQQLSLA